MSEDGVVEDLCVIEPLVNSDNCMVTFTLCCNTVVGCSVLERYMFHKGDSTNMRNFLACVCWGDVFNSLDADGMWKKFHGILFEAFHKFVSATNKCANRNFPIWMPRTALKSMRTKANLWKKYKASKSYNDLVEYK